MTRPAHSNLLGLSLPPNSRASTEEPEARLLIDLSDDDRLADPDLAGMAKNVAGNDAPMTVKRTSSNVSSSLTRGNSRADKERLDSEAKARWNIFARESAEASDSALNVLPKKAQKPLATKVHLMDASEEEMQPSKAAVLKPNVKRNSESKEQTGSTPQLPGAVSTKHLLD